MVATMAARRIRCFSTESKGPGEETAPKEEEGAAAAEEEENKELVAALKERDEYKDKLLRSYAETENMRKIKERDVANAKDFAIQKFAKSMLEVSDSLGYALAASSKEDASLKTLVDGVDMTKSQLTKAFAEHGVTEYGAIGDKFDTSLHEALFEFEDNTKDPATIGQVLKSGFLLKSRVLRAAQVGVVKASPPPPSE